MLQATLAFSVRHPRSTRLVTADVSWLSMADIDKNRHDASGSSNNSVAELVVPTSDLRVRRELPHRKRAFCSP